MIKEIEQEYKQAVDNLRASVAKLIWDKGKHISSCGCDYCVAQHVLHITWKYSSENKQERASDEL